MRIVAKRMIETKELLTYEVDHNFEEIRQNCVRYIFPKHPRSFLGEQKMAVEIAILCSGCMCITIRMFWFLVGGRLQSH